jgi:hypothetical protein
MEAPILVEILALCTPCDIPKIIFIDNAENLKS